jgi:hypothetical protein
MEPSSEVRAFDWMEPAAAGGGMEATLGLRNEILAHEPGGLRTCSRSPRRWPEQLRAHKRDD